MQDEDFDIESQKVLLERFTRAANQPPATSGEEGAEERQVCRGRRGGGGGGGRGGGGGGGIGAFMKVMISIQLCAVGVKP